MYLLKAIAWPLVKSEWRLKLGIIAHRDYKGKKIEGDKNSRQELSDSAHPGDPGEKGDAFDLIFKYLFIS